MPRPGPSRGFAQPGRGYNTRHINVTATAASARLREPPKTVVLAPAASEPLG